MLKTLCLVFKGKLWAKVLDQGNFTDWRLGDDITLEGKEFQSLIYLLWKNEYLK